jgi:hypothetical protein
MSEAAVRIQEIDLSSRVASFEGVFGAILVQAKRGRTDRPSLVDNTRQFLDRYTPNGRVEIGYDLAHYSALTYLSRSNRLHVQRVVNGALYSGSAVKSRLANTNNNALLNGFSDINAYQFDSALDVVARPEITRVTTLANTSIAPVQAVYEVLTVEDVAGSLDGKYLLLPDENGVVAFWFNISGTTLEPAHGADRSVEVTTVLEDDVAAVVASKLAAIINADSQYSAVADDNAITITLTFAGEVGNFGVNDAGFDVSELVEGADENFSLNGKGFVLFDKDGSVGVWFKVTMSASAPSEVLGADRIIEIDSLSGVANSDAVASALQAAVQADSQFTATALNNTVTITDASNGLRNDVLDDGTNFTFLAVQKGAVDVDEEDEALVIYASSEGAWGNDIGYRIITHLDDADLVAEPDSFLIEVYRRSLAGSPVERFFCSRLLDKRDGFGRNMFVEDVLQASSFIRAKNNDLIDEVYPKSQNDILYLGGGDDGLTPTNSQMVAAATNAYSNVDNLPVTLLLDGGYAVPAYQIALNTIAQTRMDCVAILSTPFSAEVSSNYLEELLDYRKVQLNLNSSYSSLYSPHVRIQDQFNDREIFISPDGFVAGSISLNANQREIWFPPAGYRRGILDVLGVSRVFESGERSALYTVGINPIKSSPGRGVVIWGQKTLLSRPSLLNRLNVRLLLIVVSTALKSFLEDYLFELNDRATRSEIEQKISDYMGNILARRGVTRFQVICDETNNTPQVIDNNQLICDVLLTPTGSVEDIPLRLVLVNSSTSFGDAVQAI